MLRRAANTQSRIGRNVRGFVGTCRAFGRVDHEQNLRVRAANAADVPAIANIVDQAYRHYVARIGRPPGPMLDDYPARVSEGVVWVASGRHQREDPRRPGAAPQKIGGLFRTSDGPEGRRSRSDENPRGAAVRAEVGAIGGEDAARRARLRLVRRYEVFSDVMNAPKAHAPALVEAWGGKTGTFQASCRRCWVVMLATSAAVVHPALFPDFCESDN